MNGRPGWKLEVARQTERSASLRALGAVKMALGIAGLAVLSS